MMRRTRRERLDFLLGESGEPTGEELPAGSRSAVEWRRLKQVWSRLLARAEAANSLLHAPFFARGGHDDSSEGRGEVQEYLRCLDLATGALRNRSRDFLEDLVERCARELGDGARRSVSRCDDVLTLEVLEERLNRREQEWVQLNLVDDGTVAGDGESPLEVRDAIVGDADRPAGIIESVSVFIESLASATRTWRGPRPA